MIRTTMTAIALVVLTSANWAEDKKPADALQGKWKVTKFSFGGLEQPAGDLAKKDPMLEFKGEEMIPWEKGAAKEGGKYKIDAGKTPATIDVETKDLGKMIGIYKIEKDVLTLCLSMEGAKRPEKFDDKDTILLVLEKAK